LTLAVTGAFADPQVEAFTTELSTRGISLERSGEFDTDVHGVEQRIVEAVSAGQLDLGWVGARAFAELGVDDFDALVAPLLIDSLATQRAVLSSDLPERMLAGLAPLGVDGLAVVGGPLRRPIAADEPLLTPGDFAGIPFYSWHGEVNKASITALGAVDVDVSPPERNAGIEDGSIRGYENTIAYLTGAAERRANILTANINLWPSIGVLIANPAVMDELSDDESRAVKAAAVTVADSWLELLVDESQLAREVCANGGSFALATPENLAELRALVEPVHDEISAEGHGYLEEIVELKGGTPPDAVVYPADCAGGG
jgi:TRAP-type C4-dicarboxylate transport system substrate-binding protein